MHAQCREDDWWITFQCLFFFFFVRKWNSKRTILMEKILNRSKWFFLLVFLINFIEIGIESTIRLSTHKMYESLQVFYIDQVNYMPSYWSEDWNLSKFNLMKERGRLTFESLDLLSCLWRRCRCLHRMVILTVQDYSHPVHEWDKGIWSSNMHEIAWISFSVLCSFLWGSRRSRLSMCGPHNRVLNIHYIIPM